MVHLDSICLLVKSLDHSHEITLMTVYLLSFYLFYLYDPKNSPCLNIGVGNLSLLQGIFPTQGSNPGLPHCRWILYQLSHKGSSLFYLFLLIFPTHSVLHWIFFQFSISSVGFILCFNLSITFIFHFIRWYCKIFSYTSFLYLMFLFKKFTTYYIIYFVMF